MKIAVTGRVVETGEIATLLWQDGQIGPPPGGIPSDSLAVDLLNEQYELASGKTIGATMPWESNGVDLPHEGSPRTFLILLEQVFEPGFSVDFSEPLEALPELVPGRIY